jgi:predicted DNA-binding protein
MTMKGNKVQLACYFRPEQVEALKRLSKKTMVPVNAYVRKAVDLLLKKEGK